jgi:hypothetical protein
MKKDDRRGAERHSPPKPVTASFGGFAARIVDISLIGCRIEHTDRLPPRARMPLRFSWRGAQVRIEGTVVRSELTSVAGKPAYVSGLEFCDSEDASPPVIRDIVGWLVAAAKKMEPHIPQPDSDEEPEVLSAKYLRCTFAGGKWSRLFVDDPAQPGDGFTIRAPSNESEADVLCRAYEQADAVKRRTMRASFQLDIARNKR